MQLKVYFLDTPWLNKTTLRKNLSKNYFFVVPTKNAVEIVKT